MSELKNLKIFASYYYHNMGFNITHIIPSSNIERDKNKFYKKNPFKSSTNDRTNYGYYRQDFNELNSFDWSITKGIGTVAGFNGLRALDFDCSSNNDFLKKSLSILNLPSDYEWVVNSGSGNGFHIIFYCDNFSFAGYKRRLKRYFPNETNKQYFMCLDFIWYNHLILPPSLHKCGRNYEFEFVQYPLSKPLVIDKQQLQKLLFEFCYQFGGFNIIKQEITSKKYYDVPIIDCPIIIDQEEYQKYLNTVPNVTVDAKNTIARYYSKIANQLDNVYKKEHYLLGINKLVEQIKSEFSNLNVFEIACGNGFWTKHISAFAKTITATDINDECLNAAKAKELSQLVSYEIQDVLDIKVNKKYDALFGGFIVSHIEKKELPDFFSSIHRAIKPNGKVMLVDNRCVSNNNMEIDFKNPDGNTYQKRITPDGEEFLILKNFLDYNEIVDILKDIAYDIEYTKLKYFWTLSYKLKKE